METNNHKPVTYAARIAGIILFVIAITVMNSCTKAPDSDSTNWWFRNGVQSGGIKSIDYGFYKHNFDKNGREIHSKSSADETFYEYDADGLLIRRPV